MAPDAPASDDPLNDTVRPYNAAMQELVEQLAEEACIGLFDAYGLKLTRVTPGSQAEEVSLTGVIGFTGPGIWGMCLLACDKEPLRASNPSGGSLRDWMAELSNQLAGRLKHKLIARGATIYITTPIVLRGARIEPMPRRHMTPRAFLGGGGSLSLWVEIETAPDFKLDKNAIDDSVNEGDALLF
jgi:Chemotaxis phosphatase CheX